MIVMSVMSKVMVISRTVKLQRSGNEGAGVVDQRATGRVKTAAGNAEAEKSAAAAAAAAEVATAATARARTKAQPLFVRVIPFNSSGDMIDLISAPSRELI